MNKTRRCAVRHKFNGLILSGTYYWDEEMQAQLDTVRQFGQYPHGIPARAPMLQYRKIVYENWERGWLDEKEKFHPASNKVD